jgi:hypothetical protein
MPRTKQRVTRGLSDEAGKEERIIRRGKEIVLTLLLLISG